MRNELQAWMEITKEVTESQAYSHSHLALTLGLAKTAVEALRKQRPNMATPEIQTWLNATEALLKAWPHPSGVPLDVPHMQQQPLPATRPAVESRGTRKPDPWQLFLERFRRDNWEGFLGEVGFDGDSPSQQWNEFQRYLLRLPARHVEQNRKEASNAAKESGVIESPVANIKYVKWWSDELVYPGLMGAWQADGLGLSREADATHPFDRAECLTCVCRYFAETDRRLCCALEELVFGCHPLAGDLTERYLRCLDDRLAALKAAHDGDPEAEFHAWLNHAEAVLSLVYDPPADVDTSWWTRIRAETQAVLEDAKSTLVPRMAKEVEVHWPLGPYSTEKAWTGTDIGIHRKFDLGKIAACLRPYLRIGSYVRRGRVIYHRY